MKIKSLGHVVLKVKDRLRSEHFYNGILVGMGSRWPSFPSVIITTLR